MSTIASFNFSDKTAFTISLMHLVSADSISVAANGSLVPITIVKNALNPGSINQFSVNDPVVKLAVMKFLIDGKKHLLPAHVHLVQRLAQKAGIISGDENELLRKLVDSIKSEILEKKILPKTEYDQLCADFERKYITVQPPESQTAEKISDTFAEIIQNENDQSDANDSDLNEEGSAASGNETAFQNESQEQKNEESPLQSACSPTKNPTPVFEQLVLPLSPVFTPTVAISTKFEEKVEPRNNEILAEDLAPAEVEVEKPKKWKTIVVKFDKPLIEQPSYFGTLKKIIKISACIFLGGIILAGVFGGASQGTSNTMRHYTPSPAPARTSVAAPVPIPLIPVKVSVPVPTPVPVPVPSLIVPVPAPIPVSVPVPALLPPVIDTVPVSDVVVSFPVQAAVIVDPIPSPAPKPTMVPAPAPAPILVKPVINIPNPIPAPAKPEPKKIKKITLLDNKNFEDNSKKQGLPLAGLAVIGFALNIIYQTGKCLKNCFCGPSKKSNASAPKNDRHPSFTPESGEEKTCSPETSTPNSNYSHTSYPKSKVIFDNSDHFIVNHEKHTPQKTPITSSTNTSTTPLQDVIVNIPVPKNTSKGIKYKNKPIDLLALAEKLGADAQKIADTKFFDFSGNSVKTPQKTEDKIKVSEKKMILLDQSSVLLRAIVKTVGSPVSVNNELLDSFCRNNMQDKEAHQAQIDESTKQIINSSPKPGPNTLSAKIIETLEVTREIIQVVRKGPPPPPKPRVTNVLTEEQKIAFYNAKENERLKHKWLDRAKMFVDFFSIPDEAKLQLLHLKELVANAEEFAAAACTSRELVLSCVHGDLENSSYKISVKAQKKATEKAKNAKESFNEVERKARVPISLENATDKFKSFQTEELEILLKILDPKCDREVNAIHLPKQQNNSAAFKNTPQNQQSGDYAAKLANYKTICIEYNNKYAEFEKLKIAEEWKKLCELRPGYKNSIIDLLKKRVAGKEKDPVRDVLRPYNANVKKADSTPSQAPRSFSLNELMEKVKNRTPAKSLTPEKKPRIESGSAYKNTKTFTVKPFTTLKPSPESPYVGSEQKKGEKTMGRKPLQITRG